ncbi:MAG: FKBP-type peptidyl-prolyl cis-trans isomerase [Deltaproteobacteria bacterium]|nr:FKBP-type peptidyl-prolyl cis-trans isomerase [Deltaproteobacteria bacterium]
MRVLMALAVLLALGCGTSYDRKAETIPADLLEDETLPEEERRKRAAEREAKKEKASQPKKPAPTIKAPVDVAAPPANAKKTDKGVYYVVLNRGSGKQKPNAKSRVKVHYSGWTTDGKLFDSSVRRGKPALFPVGALIPGWVDVLQQMVVGDKWRIWIPEDLAYKGAAGAPEGMLVFEMELLEIVSL